MVASARAKTTIYTRLSGPSQEPGRPALGQIHFWILLLCSPSSTHFHHVFPGSQRHLRPRLQQVRRHGGLPRGRRRRLDQAQGPPTRCLWCRPWHSFAPFSARLGCRVTRAASVPPPPAPFLCADSAPSCPPPPPLVWRKLRPLPPSARPWSSPPPRSPSPSSPRPPWLTTPPPFPLVPSPSPWTT